MGHIRTKDGLVNQVCIIIYKGNFPRISKGGFVVAENPLQGDIIKKGVFWTSKNAELFADMLSVQNATN